jgi:linoleate 10R-lipoxygenase
LFAEIFPNKNPEELKLSDFGRALGTKWNTLVDPNPRTRTFAK